MKLCKIYMTHELPTAIYGPSFAVHIAIPSWGEKPVENIEFFYYGKSPTGQRQRYETAQDAFAAAEQFTFGAARSVQHVIGSASGIDFTGLAAMKLLASQLTKQEALL